MLTVARKRIVRATSFDGTDDLITLQLGAAAFAFGPGTLVSVLRSGVDSTSRRPLHIGATSGGARYGFRLNSSNQIQLQCGSTLNIGPLTLTVADGWSLIAATKPTGSVVPRYHRYVFSTRTWTHTDEDVAVGNGATPTGNAYVGGHGAAEPWNGDVALGAVWDVVLSDWELEALVRDRTLRDRTINLGALLRSRPRAAWALHQARLHDLTGRGADEVTRVGTRFSDDADLPPLPFLLPVRVEIPLRVAAAGTTPVAATAAVPVEALQAIGQTAADPVEALQPVAAAPGAPVEALEQVAATAGDPVEALEGVTQTAGEPVEALQGVAATPGLPVEASGFAAALAGLPVEGLTVVVQLAGVPVEALETAAGTQGSPVESLQAVAATPGLPVEAAGFAAALAGLPVESVTVVGQAAGAPVEGLVLVVQVAGAPLEALQALAAAAGGPVEAAGFAAALASLPVESLFSGDVAAILFLADSRVALVLLSAAAFGEKTLLADTFARTVADGWGTASSGHVWSLHAGDVTDLDVDGSRGTFTLDTQTTTVVKTDVGYGDVEGSFVWTIGQDWTGNLNRLSAIVRANTALTENYTLRFEHGTNMRIHIQFLRNGSVALGAAFTVVEPYVAGDQYNVRFSVVGSALRAKCWKVGTQEPAGWQIDVTDTVVSADAHTRAAFSFQRVSTNTFLGTIDDVAYSQPAGLPGDAVVSSAAVALALLSSRAG